MEDEQKAEASNMEVFEEKERQTPERKGRTTSNRSVETTPLSRREARTTRSQSKASPSKETLDCRRIEPAATVYSESSKSSKVTIISPKNTIRRFSESAVDVTKKIAGSVIDTSKEIVFSVEENNQVDRSLSEDPVVFSPVAEEAPQHLTNDATKGTVNSVETTIEDTTKLLLPRPSNPLESPAATAAVVSNSKDSMPAHGTSPTDLSLVASSTTSRTPTALPFVELSVPQARGMADDTVNFAIETTTALKSDEPTSLVSRSGGEHLQLAAAQPVKPRAESSASATNSLSTQTPIVHFALASETSKLSTGSKPRSPSPKTNPSSSSSVSAVSVTKAPLTPAAAPLGAPIIAPSSTPTSASVVPAEKKGVPAASVAALSNSHLHATPAIPEACIAEATTKILTSNAPTSVTIALPSQTDGRSPAASFQHAIQQAGEDEATTIARAPLVNIYGSYLCHSTDRSLHDARQRLKKALEQTRNLRQTFTERVYGKYRVCLRPPQTT